MGAKQSKRSVDISGKEAEGAGEVAAAGAGGEGRVEQLADADALKPQLNGDAHIHEPTDKEKELDSGTPENEKDATTEKENKEQEEEKDKEATPVSNGDGEQKAENGDAATTPDDGKKPKKEKVKKKWSLRSISFSRKDKPKQEKKQKEEEPKTNGEPEKVPEETAETSPEPVVNEETEEIKTSVEAKDEKTPDTPVTEPITNGSSTPESPKVEIPVAEETTAVLPEAEKSEITPEPEPVPELPINGLSLEETKQEIPEIENKIEEIIGSKPEETPVETTEVVPVPEIPVKKEVCVEQVPLIEPTPPPLPANPPPSSVASFAATTMAPELTDASLSNTAETAVPSQPSVMDSNTSLSDNHSEPQTNLTNVTPVTDVLTLPSKETTEENIIDNLIPDESNVISETSAGALEINIQNKIEESQNGTVPKEIIEILPEIVVPEIVNSTELSKNEADPTEADEIVSEVSENNIDAEGESIPAKQVVDENVTEASEIKDNLTEVIETKDNVTAASETKESVAEASETKESVAEASEAEETEIEASVTIESVVESTETKERVIEPIETKENVNAETETKDNVTKVSDTKTEMTTEISQNDLESQEVAQAIPEIVPDIIVNEPKETESTAVLVDTILPMDEAELKDTANVTSAEVKEKDSEVVEMPEEIPITSETNATTEPPVVAETVDVELPPLPPVVTDEKDTKSDAMDESNDADVQETINPTIQIDSNIGESNIDTEIIKAKETIDIAEDNNVIKEENVETYKDSLGNVIETVECNGNIDNIDTAQEIVEEPTGVAPPVEDKMILNAEAENVVETPGDAMPPSLSEANEPMPAGDSAEESEAPQAPHTPQDSLPEMVCDKMAEFITDVSPVPELKTETETSTDVAVAN